MSVSSRPAVFNLSLLLVHLSKSYFFLRDVRCRTRSESVLHFHFSKRKFKLPWSTAHSSWPSRQIRFTLVIVGCDTCRCQGSLKESRVDAFVLERSPFFVNIGRVMTVHLSCARCCTQPEKQREFSAHTTRLTPRPDARWRPAKYGVMDEEPRFHNQRVCVIRRLAFVALKDALKATQEEWQQHDGRLDKELCLMRVVRERKNAMPELKAQVGGGAHANLSVHSGFGAFSPLCFLANVCSCVAHPFHCTRFDTTKSTQRLLAAVRDRVCIIKARAKNMIKEATIDSGQEWLSQQWQITKVQTWFRFTRGQPVSYTLVRSAQALRAPAHRRAATQIEH